MKEFRNDLPMKQWTNGPGKLTKAMGITMEHYGSHWTEKPLYIAEGEPVTAVSTGPRIGIENSGEAVHYPIDFGKQIIHSYQNEDNTRHCMGKLLPHVFFAWKNRTCINEGANGHNAN